jgi:hypothetical protein
MDGALSESSVSRTLILTELGEMSAVVLNSQRVSVTGEWRHRAKVGESTLMPSTKLSSHRV